MKNILLSSLLTFLFCLAGASVQAQEYKTSIGLRFGSPWAASFKYNLTETSTVEAMLGYRRSLIGTIVGLGYSSVNIGALYQINNEIDIDDIDGFRWYYGGGGSVYFWSYDDNFVGAEAYNSLTIGIHGTLGLDYAFEDAPINLSLDWMPTFIIGDGYRTGFRAGFYALSARYILAR